MKRVLAMILAGVLAIGTMTACSKQQAADPAAEKTAENAAEKETEAAVEWPTGTVQLLVAAKAGGGTDLVARVVAEKMSEVIGENVVVVNQTEGAGAVAFSTVMDDDQDALQLGFFIPSFFTSYITGSVDMNPLSDFQCASFLGCDDANFFVVSQNSQYTTMEELIAYAKENPGVVTMGLSLGSRTHFTVAEFAKAAGIEFKYVEAGNSADQVTALLGGHIDVTLLNIANTMSYVSSGDVKVLAVTGEPAERTEELKDVPTFADLGYTDLKCKCDFFVITGNATPEATVQKINQVMQDVFADEELQKAILALGYRFEALDVENGNQAYKAAYDTFDSVGEMLGVKAQ